MTLILVLVHPHSAGRIFAARYIRHASDQLKSLLPNLRNKTPRNLEERDRRSKAINFVETITEVMPPYVAHAFPTEQRKVWLEVLWEVPFCREFDETVQLGDGYFEDLVGTPQHPIPWMRDPALRSRVARGVEVVQPQDPGQDSERDGDANLQADADGLTPSSDDTIGGTMRTLENLELEPRLGNRLGYRPVGRHANASAQDAQGASS